MDEPTAVLTPQADAGAAAPEAAPQATPPPGEAQNQSAGTVEPAEQTSRTDQGRPSDFWANRQISKLNKELREMKALLLERGNVPQNQPQNPQPWQPKPLPLEQFHPEGVAQWVNETLSGMKQQFMQETQDAFTQWQMAREQSIRNQEVAEALEKYESEGKLDRIQEILVEQPWLNEWSRKEPLKAMAKCVEIMEKDRKSPLAPQKSRAGIAGSGTPPGTSGGDLSKDAASLMKKAELLKSQFSERRGDPEFMKEYKKVMDSLTQISKK